MEQRDQALGLGRHGQLTEALGLRRVAVLHALVQAGPSGGRSLRISLQPSNSGSSLSEACMNDPYIQCYLFYLAITYNLPTKPS